MLEVDVELAVAPEGFYEISSQQPHSKYDYSCIANDSFPVA